MAALFLAHIAMPSTKIIASSLLIIYSLLCRVLRFRARNNLHQRFNYPTRASLAKMTNDDAQAILSWLAELEFPEMYYRSLQYALFKTYAFPQMSRVLVSTKQLVAPEYSPQRYVDTVLLINEFCGNPPTSPRALKAIARMNFLHSQYIARGAITQPDLLYTLSVFITEPITWINKCEWRQLSPMETCAISTFWKSIGDAMGIKYNTLRRYGKWEDGIEFYEDIRDWAASYEDQHRVPAESNLQTANSTVAILLSPIPFKAKDVAFQLLCALMEDGVRTAMMYPKPPALFYRLASFLITIRRFLLRNLFLPRPSFLRVRFLSNAPDPKTGRYHATHWDYHPFYVLPSFWNRWGPLALLCRLQGRDVPGMKNEIYGADGYVLEEVGPRSARGKGVEAMRETEETLRVERTGGCPFPLKVQ